MDFFSRSYYLDKEVLRPLSHIMGNWELTWDAEEQKYVEEEGSYAGLLNQLIVEIGKAHPPKRYHDNEDRLGEYVQKHLNWGILKKGKWWIGCDYVSLIQQGGFGDTDQADMFLAAAGRIHAAKKRGQLHYDVMEESHRRILGVVITAILYHRTHLIQK